jgi:hypothetical protein
MKGCRCVSFVGLDVAGAMYSSKLEAMHIFDVATDSVLCYKGSLFCFHEQAARASFRQVTNRSAM